jgi:SNF2 family DNA or RNA helicase
MKHQQRVFRRSRDKRAFALLMQQGTGKSRVVIDTAAYLYNLNLIDMLFIVAPRGVAPAWIREQLPTHMPRNIEYSAAQWKADSRRTREDDRRLAHTLGDTDKLRVIVMNTEAMGSTASAIDFAMGTLDSARSALLVVDESHRIKTPTAHTTKRVINLRNHAAYRRILTGTVGDKPFDLWSQFYFLDPEILGIDNFTAFRAEYAELLPDSAGLMRHIAMRIPKKWTGRYIDEITGQPVDGAKDEDGLRRRKEMKPAYMPTIVAKNDDGTPKYRNLDKLSKLIEPHSFRVLKVDCLDLPEKLYNRYYTQLTDKQWAIYKQVRDDLRIEWEDHISTFNRLTAMLRLQQIACGYVGEGDTIINIFDHWSENPRINSLLELISDRPENESSIIWCRFREDIWRVSDALRATYGNDSVVQFYGDVSDAGRIDAVARFQGERQIMDKQGKFVRSEPEPNRARFMVAQPASGGLGQTWTAATLSVQYSNTFSLIDRLQAEDRPHRIGQRNPVQYIDLEAEDTVDGVIITSLIAKKEVADVINNDKDVAWLT